MHSVDERMHDARTSRNQPQALRARVWPATATCCSGVRRLKMFTLLFARACASFRARVALWRVGAHDTAHPIVSCISCTMAAARSAPRGPLQDPAAAATYHYYETHWEDDYKCAMMRVITIYSIHIHAKQLSTRDLIECLCRERGERTRPSHSDFMKQQLRQAPFSDHTSIQCPVEARFIRREKNGSGRKIT